MITQTGHKLLLALLVLAVHPCVGQAQELSSFCREIYPAPSVGEFAEVRFSSPSQGSVQIRFAVIDSATVEDESLYWIEVVTSPPNAEGQVVAQMLVPGYPFTVQQLEGYIVKLPGQPARRMPQDMVEQLNETATPGLGWEEACQNAEDLGSTQVTVPAGTFDTRHFRARDESGSEVWISPNVPFGLVKMLRGQGTMELIRYGSDAESAIEEDLR